VSFQDFGNPFDPHGRQLILRPFATFSIFFYLMDSDGQFVDAFGKNSTSPEITAKVMDHVEKWKAAGRSI
jgi:hypothetical protein